MPTLQEHYRTVRNDSERLCQPLAVEDYVIQTIPDVSPPKWHLAHTTWFFENFLLVPELPGYEVFHPRFGYLFNSYYETVGSFFPRPQRGLLSRPTVEEIYRYRRYVDEAMTALLSQLDAGEYAETLAKIRLGLEHEQQHQELLLTDIKYNFAFNPLRPAYQTSRPPPVRTASSCEWLGYTGGLRQIGHDDGTSFAFDNETPRHTEYLQDYRLASRLVTNGEYREFIEAGGYQQSALWLSDGWATVNQRGWQHPLYWEQEGHDWYITTLNGRQALNDDEPVCHVSFYEADAYARWRHQRLPTEAEWECAAQTAPVTGNLRDTGYLHPIPAAKNHPQWFGDVWEWTSSPYRPYPGFRPLAGTLGEYNGKFMCNQLVLRGGSCVTPEAHVRATYRNFFYPRDRWQFTGIRLAGD